MTAATVDRCPGWCVDGPNECDGAHWSEGAGVLPSLRRPGSTVVDSIGVYVRQDCERVPADRDPSTMDRVPHVLVHVFGDAGQTDSEAHMTAGEARALAALLVNAAAAVEQSHR